MPLHRNIYSFVFRGEHTPESRDVIWIHHQTKNDLKSPIVAEIWIRDKWEPLIWGANNQNSECCCCGSPFVRDEGKASAAMRAASNIAKGNYSLAAGHNTYALRDESIGIGNGLITGKKGQVVLGNYNIQSDKYQFIIGAGTNAVNRKNAIVIDENGLVTINNLYTPQNMAAWQFGSGENSVQLAGGSSASGDESVAAGIDTIASGKYSFSSGKDTKATGDDSVALGTGTIASGRASLSEGHSTESSGDYSHAEGWRSSATRTGSHSEGLRSVASGNYSHAEGERTNAQGKASHTSGVGTIAIADGEAAFGTYNQVNNNQIFSIGIGDSDTNRRNAFEIYKSGVIKAPNIEGYIKTSLIQTDEDKKSISLGVNSQALGASSVAIGNRALASGNNSQAFGYEVESVGFGSHVEGYLSRAIGDESHAEGSRTLALGFAAHAEGYAQDEGEILALGDGSHAEGHSYAIGDYAHSEGYSDIYENTISIGYQDGEVLTENSIRMTIPDLTVTQEQADQQLQNTPCKISGTYTTIVGCTVLADHGFIFEVRDNFESILETGDIELYRGGAYGDYSHAEGYCTESNGISSHAEGENCSAEGRGSHAEGNTSISTGEYSHAEGSACHASGNSSHAGGTDSWAYATASFAHGDECHAHDANSVALGYLCHASGEASIVAGSRCTSDANAAVVLGLDNQALYEDGEFACGKYNSSKPNMIFSVGIGSSSQNRKNAIEVYSDGEIKLYSKAKDAYYTLDQIINALGI